VLSSVLRRAEPDLRNGVVGDLDHLGSLAAMVTVSPGAMGIWPSRMSSRPARVVAVRALAE
jgi:hypothetical protein